MIEKLVLLRHGESMWNKQNIFTGWTDVDLSDNGINEAVKAGRLLRENGFRFDVAYTSMLKRAVKTLWYVLDEMDLDWIPVYKSWRLNERHYGALQGMNKSETAEIYGQKQVDLWRRSYDVSPPGLDKGDERYPGKDPRYAFEPAGTMPSAESLKNTEKRLVPYWKDVIVPQIMMGKRVIISAHGNSLRSLAKILENISDTDIPKIEIPTGIPLVYELDRDIRPIKKYYIEA